jgi:hypothetical protein
VGEVYTRDDLRRMFGITDATLNTGIFHPPLTQSVWIFVTEKMAKDRTQYKNRLDGDILTWDGQTLGRKDPLIIEHAERNLEVLLFYREEKYEHPGAGFRYEGQFKYEKHSGSRPTQFVLRRVSTVTDSADVSDALLALTEVSGRRRSGQGFRISPEARKAVEDYAMRVVADYYREEDWSVDDSVASRECFDLRCTRRGAELHVEVKGTTSRGEQIILTRNEVDHAREQHPRIALAIVRNIDLQDGNPPVASGGELAVFDPWRIDDGTLTTLASSYDVPLDSATFPTGMHRRGTLRAGDANPVAAPDNDRK